MRTQSSQSARNHPAQGVAVLAVMIVVTACGASPVPTSVASPTPSPAAQTLADIASQPEDVPALHLTVCMSKTLSEVSGSSDIWNAALAAGAVEGWVKDLMLDCSSSVNNSSRAVNDLLRFRDAAAAQAFFAHDKSAAKANVSVLWPTGAGNLTEGTATGFGASSVTLNAADFYCAFWIRGAIASSYCTALIGQADGLLGAKAVDGRMPVGARY